MRREPELLCKILVMAESSASLASPLYSHEVEGEDRNDVVARHMSMLAKKGLVEVVDFTSQDGEAMAIIEVTMDGHDALDTMRQTLPQRARNVMGAVATSTVQALLTQAASEVLLRIMRGS